MTLDDGSALDVTEQGKRKSVAAWITDDVDALPTITRLGVPADTMSGGTFAALCATSSRLKTLLTDQSRMAGIGNAWSDEILHTARLSPFAAGASLDAPARESLFAAIRDVLGTARSALEAVPLDRIKKVKKSLFRVHGRTGEACPVCGTAIAQVAYSDHSLQYCPRCQTGGRRLSDRRMDRLLK